MRVASAWNDEELRNGLAAGLDVSFPTLILAYQDRLYSFALRVLGHPSDAEEAAQDAFLRAYRALQSYPPERTRALALKPWLYKIVLNVCRNRLRVSRPATLSIDLERDDDREGPLQLPDDERLRPERLFERAEEQRQLAEMLSALPERFRVVVVLRFVEQLSYGEVAEILRQPVGTVKSNVHRGVQLLRMGMEQRERVAIPSVEVQK